MGGRFAGVRESDEGPLDDRPLSCELLLADEDEGGAVFPCLRALKASDLIRDF